MARPCVVSLRVPSSRGGTRLFTSAPNSRGLQLILFLLLWFYNQGSFITITVRPPISGARTFIVPSPAWCFQWGVFRTHYACPLPRFLGESQNLHSLYVSVHHQKTPGPLVTCTLCLRVATKCPESVFVSFVNAHQKRSVSLCKQKRHAVYFFRLSHVRKIVCNFDYQKSTVISNCH